MGEMACEVMYSWSLSGLVGIFLDLVIAYFLLCASAMAFIASKFLGFFGLGLPCPCNGLFGITYPNNNLCLQRLLIDCPTQKVSNVQLSLKKKFPFNGFSWEKDKNCDFGVQSLVEERKSDYVNGFVEMDGEASCSSVTDGRKPRNFVRCREGLSGMNSNSVVREGRFDVKGKGVVNQRPRGWLRRRRKKGVDCGKASSVSSCDPPFGDVPCGLQSPYSSINKGGNRMVEDRMVNLDNGVLGHDSYYGQASRVSRSGQRDSSLLDEFDEEDENEKNLSSSGSVIRKSPREMAFDVGEKHAIELLEQAVKEEHAARSALYLELEKERNAAATAADEAMAMILRLQEEKASLEMEARQHQRIIEEQSAYDAEEMNILKEILVRREREKLFLEKEVEAYRQMTNLANEQLPDDVEDIMATDKQPLDSLLDPNEDPVLMLHQLSEAIDKKALAKDMATLLRNNDEDQKFQEKEIISMVDNLYVPPQDGQRLETLFQACESGSSQEHNLPEKTIPIISEEHKKEGSIMDDGMMRNDSETRDKVDSHIPNNNENMEHHGKDAFQEVKGSCNMAFDGKLQFDDVHVIVEGTHSHNEDKRSHNERSFANDTAEGTSKTARPPEASHRHSPYVIRDCPSTSSLNAERDVQRSASDIAGRLPPIDPRTRSLLSDLRRNSMSPIEYERTKIENEVECLRERLKAVQEGRGKLNLSVDHQEKEKLQLKLLEDISRQLQEIRQLTEPGKAIRQRSLPPPSTEEVMTQKRRSQSASGNQKSS